MIKTRVEKIQSNLDTNTAVLITSDSVRFYLTGFKSSAGYIVISKSSATLLIDFRYYEKAKSQVESMQVQLLNKRITDINEILSENNIKKIFVETSHMSIDEFFSLKNSFLSVEVSNDNFADTLISEMRSVKEKEELECIKKAQQFTDETYSYILKRIKKGMTEKEVMLDMEYYLRRLGSEGVSFDFIVVSGKNSSLPHGVPTDKKIENGDFVTMDFGAVYNGYRSDMTRTVAVGDISDEQKRVYDTVLKAQTESIKAIKQGAVCCDIDKIARDIIANAGYDGCFGHGLGHSVGIEIHENPALNTVCKQKLKAGTVMTVEPGIYIENKFGVRIEDMVFVTENGCVDITKSPKNLIVL